MMIAKSADSLRDCVLTYIMNAPANFLNREKEMMMMMIMRAGDGVGVFSRGIYPTGAVKHFEKDVNRRRALD